MMTFIFLQPIQSSLSDKNIIFLEKQNSLFSELLKVVNHFSDVYETGTLTTYPKHPKFNSYSAKRSSLSKMQKVVQNK